MGIQINSLKSKAAKDLQGNLRQSIISKTIRRREIWAEI